MQDAIELSSIPKQFDCKIFDNHLEGLSPLATKGGTAHCIDCGHDAEIKNGSVYLLVFRDFSTGFYRATVIEDRIRFAPASRDLEYNARNAFMISKRELLTSESVAVLGMLHSVYYQFL